MRVLPHGCFLISVVLLLLKAPFGGSVGSVLEMEYFLLVLLELVALQLELEEGSVFGGDGWAF